MIYLDYSATTPVAPEALDAFVEAARRYYANPNSLHAPGVAAAEAVAKATQDPVDPSPQLGVVVRLGDVVLGDLVEQLGLRIGGVDRGEDDDREVGPRLDRRVHGQERQMRNRSTFARISTRAIRLWRVMPEEAQPLQAGEGPEANVPGLVNASQRRRH